MKFWRSLALLALVLLVGCAQEQHPIDRLAATLSANAAFGDEHFDLIDLSPSLRAQAVVEQAMEQHHGKGFLHQVLEVREGLLIKGQVYTAVLMNTNLGQEIVLVRYDEDRRGWWSRIYSVRERKI